MNEKAYFRRYKVSVSGKLGDGSVAYLDEEVRIVVDRPDEQVHESVREALGVAQIKLRTPQLQDVRATGSVHID